MNLRRFRMARCFFILHICNSALSRFKSTRRAIKSMLGCTHVIILKQTVRIIRRSWTGRSEFRKFAGRQFLAVSALRTVAASATAEKSTPSKLRIPYQQITQTRSIDNNRQEELAVQIIRVSSSGEDTPLTYVISVTPRKPKTQLRVHRERNCKVTSVLLIEAEPREFHSSVGGTRAAVHFEKHAPSF